MGTPPIDYGSPQPQDPLAALKATMARIVNRGAVEAGEGPRQAIPTLLPPGAGIGDNSPAITPLVAPLSSEQTPPAEAPLSEMPPASHPTPPITPRSYPTPRGNIDRTLELGPPSAATVHNQPADDKGADAATDADRTNYGGATIDLPPPKQKQPSTYDDRRIAQTMAAAAWPRTTPSGSPSCGAGTFDPEHLAAHQLERRARGREGPRFKAGHQASGAARRAGARPAPAPITNCSP